MDHIEVALPLYQALNTAHEHLLQFHQSISKHHEHNESNNWDSKITTESISLKSVDLFKSIAQKLLSIYREMMPENLNRDTIDRLGYLRIIEQDFSILTSLILNRKVVDSVRCHPSTSIMLPPPGVPSFISRFKELIKSVNLLIMSWRGFLEVYLAFPDASHEDLLVFPEGQKSKSKFFTNLYKILLVRKMRVTLMLIDLLTENKNKPSLECYRDTWRLMANQTKDQLEELTQFTNQPEIHRSFIISFLINNQNDKETRSLRSKVNKMIRLIRRHSFDRSANNSNSNSSLILIKLQKILNLKFQFIQAIINPNQLINQLNSKQLIKITQSVNQIIIQTQTFLKKLIITILVNNHQFEFSNFQTFNIQQPKQNNNDDDVNNLKLISETIRQSIWLIHEILIENLINIQVFNFNNRLMKFDTTKNNNNDNSNNNKGNNEKNKHLNQIKQWEWLKNWRFDYGLSWDEFNKIFF